MAIMTRPQRSGGIPRAIAANGEEEGMIRA